MRELLFRGQTRRKGEKVWMDGSPVDSNWVEGYGVCMGSGCQMGLLCVDVGNTLRGQAVHILPRCVVQI